MIELAWRNYQIDSMNNESQNLSNDFVKQNLGMKIQNSSHLTRVNVLVVYTITVAWVLIISSDKLEDIIDNKHGKEFQM